MKPARRGERELRIRLAELENTEEPQADTKDGDQGRICQKEMRHGYELENDPERSRAESSNHPYNHWENCKKLKFR